VAAPPFEHLLWRAADAWPAAFAALLLQELVVQPGVHLQKENAWNSFTLAL